MQSAVEESSDEFWGCGVQAILNETRAFNERKIPSIKTHRFEKKFSTKNDFSKFRSRNLRNKRESSDINQALNSQTFRVSLSFVTMKVC